MSAINKYSFICGVFLLLTGTFSHICSASTTDTLKQYTIGPIVISGNKTTKYNMITRELIFHEGETTDTASLRTATEQSRRNLMNTGLFNEVNINYHLSNNNCEVYIQLTERWYIWPSPILEIPDRNFNIWWQQRDISRLNYGAYVLWNNFRGRRELLQFIIRLGYSERFGLAYDIPNLGKKQRHGFGFSYTFSRNHEIGYKSVNNVLLFFKDTEQHIREENNAKLRYTYRKNIFNTHTMEARYQYIHVGDTIVKMAPEYTGNQKNTLQFFTLDYLFIADHRDYKPYPLKGWLLSAEATQNGLGLLKHEEVSFLKLETGFRYYYPIAGPWFSGLSFKTKWSSTGFQPYYIQRGLGYGDNIRGYEYYVMDGNKYINLKSNIKYRLVKPTYTNLHLFNNERFDRFFYAFYMNAFFDAGYVKDHVYFSENSLNNNWQYAYGIGLDFLTYYDMVLRFEVARNRLTKTGFFFHYFAAF